MALWALGAREFVDVGTATASRGPDWGIRDGADPNGHPPPEIAEMYHPLLIFVEKGVSAPLADGPG
jgi:hypothetical protein